MLLFAVRESVQESLGFSPFELVFGHTVRGPLKLLKEKFLSDDDSSLNLLQYVSDFKNRLSKACEAARSNLKSAQSKMKLHYDENAQDRNFEPGDKVFALLPIPGKPLQARYYGLYTVDKKLVMLITLSTLLGGANKNSYVISTCLKSTLIGIVLLFHQ